MKGLLVSLLVLYVISSPTHQLKNRNQVFLCNFDFYEVDDENYCGEQVSTGTGIFGITTFADLPTKPTVKITDFTSLTSLENEQGSCVIPFKINEEDQFFCVLNNSRYECQINADGNFAECQTGQFLRVRSNRFGDPFERSLTFSTPLNVKVGSSYRISMYTLINCGRAGCEAGGDVLSVKVRGNEDGEFTEVYNVTERTADFRWINESFSVKAESNQLYIRLDFSRSHKTDGEALLLVDQLEVVEEDDTSTVVDQSSAAPVDAGTTEPVTKLTSSIILPGETTTVPVDAGSSTTQKVTSISPGETTKTPVDASTTDSVDTTTTQKVTLFDETTTPATEMTTSKSTISYTKTVLCTFDEFDVDSYDSCGKIESAQIGDSFFSALQLDSLPSSKKITDYTSIAGNTVGNKNCIIPFTFSNEPSYFCALEDSKFVCEVDKDGTRDECNLGRFIRVKSNSAGAAFTSSFEFKDALVTQPGLMYGLSMHSLINCGGKPGCEDAHDTISVKIKHGDDGDFAEMYNVNGRFNDNQWVKDLFYFKAENTRIFVKIDFSREFQKSGVANFYVDQLEFYEESPVITTETPAPTTSPEIASGDQVFCDFDAFTTGNFDVCGGISYLQTGSAQISGLQLDPLPSNTLKYITDYSSIQGKTESSKQCVIPFNFGNDSAYFCVLDNSKYVCETQDTTFDQCNLERFMRVKSSSKGQAFRSSLSFTKGFIAKPRQNYTLRINTLINCGSVGCAEQAQDSLKVRVKDGAQGSFVEVITVSGRSTDNRWYADVATFYAEYDRLYVRLDFARNVDHTSVANIYFDQIEIFPAQDGTTSTPLAVTESTTPELTEPTTTTTITTTTTTTTTATSTTTTTSPTTNITASTVKPTNLPAILGGSIGGAVGLIIIIVIIIFLVKKYKGTSKVEAEDDNVSTAEATV